MGAYRAWLLEIRRFGNHTRRSVCSAGDVRRREYLSSATNDVIQTGSPKVASIVAVGAEYSDPCPLSAQTAVFKLCAVIIGIIDELHRRTAHVWQL